ncbi:MAG: hypothetical protein HRU34_24020 [Richelia sp.]|nr:hypothetical protein [Richelia sp.]
MLGCCLPGVPKKDYNLKADFLSKTHFAYWYFLYIFYFDERSCDDASRKRQLTRTAEPHISLFLRRTGSEIREFDN